MFINLRKRAGDESGFTLIELLVVILIIGILAAIALPSFINQRAKAQDTEAKSNARTAQTAMETYFTDGQTYTGASKAALVTVEPALGDANFTATPTADGGSYTVVATSKSSGSPTFTITNTAGTVNRTCSAPGKGGCPAAVGTATAGVW